MVARSSSVRVFAQLALYNVDTTGCAQLMLTLQGVNKLKQNPTELERIVKNHLVRGLVKADDLADDLVGPSVAGTKLRSNVYHSEDRDWRDVKVRRVKQLLRHIIGDVQVITINGANVLRTDVATAEGRGLVHVVDRVLFPPTVGDVVQTLQVDTLHSRYVFLLL